MSEEQMIAVEVAYALPRKQKIIALSVPQGTTALAAVEQSGIVRDFPEIDIASAKFGLFGQALGTKGMSKAPEYELNEGDRIEIYRPLTADPKEVRRKRAEKAKAAEKAAE